MPTINIDRSQIGQNISSVNSYIQSQLGVGANGQAWCGYYLGAVMKENGYSIPSDYYNSQSWLNYGQAVEGSPQIGDIAVWGRNASGYGHVGIITGFVDDGSPDPKPIILSGNNTDGSGGKVAEYPVDPAGLTFRRPVAANGATPDGVNGVNGAAGGGTGGGGTGGGSPGGGSPGGGSPGGGSPGGGSPGGGGTPGGSPAASRKGKQDGNEDTHAANSSTAQSGPICGGSDKPDIQGTPSNYRRTTVKSACTRVPTHEPFLGHPKTMLAERAGSAGGSSPQGAGGGGSPQGAGGGGTPGGKGTSPTPGGGPSDQTPGTAKPGDFGTTFNDKAAEITRRLMNDFGLTRNQAVGIVGNLGHESAGLKNDIQEQNPTAGRGGLGWAQWTGPRRVAFEKYLAETGQSASSAEANYGFLKRELETTEKGAIAAVKRTDSVADATRAFENSFERAGVKNYSSRDAYAERAGKAFDASEAAAAKADAEPKPDNPAQDPNSPQADATAQRDQAQKTAEAAKPETSDPGKNEDADKPADGDETDPSSKIDGDLNKNKYNPNAYDGDPNAKADDADKDAADPDKKDDAKTDDTTGDKTPAAADAPTTDTPAATPGTSTDPSKDTGLGTSNDGATMSPFYSADGEQIGVYNRASASAAFNAQQDARKK